MTRLDIVKNGDKNKKLKTKRKPRNDINFKSLQSIPILDGKQPDKISKKNFTGFKVKANQFKSKKNSSTINLYKQKQQSPDTTSLITEQEENQLYSLNISGLVSTNQREISEGPFPQYEPPSGWKKLETSEISTFDFKNVHNEDNELWLFKIPPNISKSDLQGLTLKLPTGLSRIPTKVATIQQELQEHLYKKKNSESAEYHVYEMPNDDDISQENEMGKGIIRELRAPHETIYKQMKGLEILLPCHEAQGLLLSHKKPTRYFNICRPVNPPDSNSNIDSILAKRRDTIIHPPETFVPRYTTTFPDYSKKHMIEANAAKEKFRNKMMNEWKFPKWQQQIKKHEEMVESSYREYKKKCKIAVNQSKRKFAKEVKDKKGWDVLGIKKRKTSSNGGNMEDGDGNSSTASSSIESEERLPNKTKILADLKRQRNFEHEDPDIDLEIFEEVAEEEMAFVQLAQNQIYQRRRTVKEAREAEKMASVTWVPALVNYPTYKPPETWWSKTYDKIFDETSKTKFRPKLTKWKYTLEERLEYYRRHGCEPPSYAAAGTRGHRIEINYDGIEGNLEIPKLNSKRILPPPSPGTTGHLRPCVELIDNSKC
ncbi:6325_t:CDS:2 [Funneliformis geosporum]|uniref:15593_t:CDS:1 n=1 Tax=Funneliformis geosporum TaxID=1117311 RepID=A0A9W4WT57_9GLOM|nr:15593_t:CDS:2 [Funneliformis geosporum]CAI2165671.1 6325_t:CDS:2 [Funneliformis geosporum]